MYCVFRHSIVMCCKFLITTSYIIPEVCGVLSLLRAFLKSFCLLHFDCSIFPVITLSNVTSTDNDVRSESCCYWHRSIFHFDRFYEKRQELWGVLSSVRMCFACRKRARVRRHSVTSQSSPTKNSSTARTFQKELICSTKRCASPSTCLRIIPMRFLLKFILIAHIFSSIISCCFYFVNNIHCF